MTLLPKLEKIDSRSELLEVIVHAKESMLIGEDTEAPSYFYRITPIGDRDVAVGIISGETGIKPQLLEFHGSYILGFDQQIIQVSLDPLEERNALSLDGVFYEFIEHPAKNRLLLVHELGVVCVNTNLAVVWSVDTDILTSWKIVDDAIFLQDQESLGFRKVDLSSGLDVHSLSDGN